MKKVKILGITIISLIWVFCLIIILSISATLYVMYKMENSKKDMETDVVRVIDKIQYVQLATIEVEPYNQSTIYSVELSNGISKLVTFPGIHNYRPGTYIEIYYIKYDLIGIIEIIDFNAELDSDTTILNSDFKHPFWEDVKNIEVGNMY